MSGANLRDADFGNSWLDSVSFVSADLRGFRAANESFLACSRTSDIDGFSADSGHLLYRVGAVLMVVSTSSDHKARKLWTGLAGADIGWAVSGDNSILVSRDDKSFMIDIETSKRVAVHDLPVVEGSYNLVPHYRHDLAGLDVLNQISSRLEEEDYMWAVSSQGAVAFGGPSGIRVVRLEPYAELWRRRVAAGVGNVMMSPDGAWVATSSAAGEVALHDSRTGEVMWRSFHNDKVRGARFLRADLEPHMVEALELAGAVLED